MLRGEIYIAELGEPNGNVQAGCRPVLILQNNTGNKHAPTTIVTTITTASKKTNLPTHINIGKVGGLIHESYVTTEQIQTINKTSLKKYIGKISDKRTLNKINRAIKKSLNLK